MRKILLGLGAVIFIGVIGYFSGPKAEPISIDPLLPENHYQINTVEEKIRASEEHFDTKPNNAATIVWADSSGKKTPYSIVYLHGFSASHEEGAPLHREMAKRYGMNLYLSRLEGHGLRDEEPLLSMTAEGLLQSAKDAINVGQTIGEKVILMTCSTGSALGLYLASAAPEVIEAIICYSPNVDMANPATHLLDDAWGLQIVRMAEGGQYHIWEAPEEALNYWYTKYRVESLIELRQLVDATMQEEVFANIRQPTLLLYYYKSEEDQDNTVSVDAMLTMFDQLGTPDALKKQHAIPEAGKHVICSPIFSNDVESVRSYTRDFFEDILEISPQ